MASFSFKGGLVPSADGPSSNLQNDHSSSSPDRGLALLRNPQSLPISAPATSLHASFRSNHDLLPGPFTPRSSKGMVICSFAIAATSAISLSLFSLDGIAIAAELETNNTAIVSVTSAHGSPNLKADAGHDPKLILTLSPSTSSNNDPDLSLSMAIPIPREEVWSHAQNGLIAPLPQIHEHGLVMPLSPPRKTAVALAGSTLKCPQWTPSELEMVLPDFHGRPKPFPHQGHHWFASYVTKGTHGEAFLQLSDSNDGVELDELDGKMMMATKENANKQQKEDKLSLLKVLGTEIFTCFSM